MPTYTRAQAKLEAAAQSEGAPHACSRRPQRRRSLRDATAEGGWSQVRRQRGEGRDKVGRGGGHLRSSSDEGLRAYTMICEGPPVCVRVSVQLCL